ncbi:hypothetical protein DPMN_153689 [Dreissena polymorpha]|uniref:Uncharacterized protein n=1 Tax=Dreissena polymorpha TaxID=45954 RepID=A0A9D4FJ24_DREPO|nr:hypothetical protein DPMN_153689 [Dreissena polymorpha]
MVAPCANAKKDLRSVLINAFWKSKHVKNRSKYYLSCIAVLRCINSPVMNRLFAITF